MQRGINTVEMTHDDGISKYLCGETCGYTGKQRCQNCGYYQFLAADGKPMITDPLMGE